jgi:hypothetical protein
MYPWQRNEVATGSVRAFGQLADALASPSSGLSRLLPLLDRRFHVVTASLELAEDTLGRHLALEVLDRALEPTFTDVNFDWFALNGLDHERFCSLQERRRLTQCTQARKESPGLESVNTLTI